MYSIPLPASPDIENYRKQAKSRAKEAKCKLSTAQFRIAREHGFESWPKFKKHLEALKRETPISRFEAAADAIVDGNLDKLKGFLDLVHATSSREHSATLLHYTASNGVEDFRQKCPPNIVEIVKLLLEAGAEIDARANAYGSRLSTLHLAATSIHPVKAGVLEPLLQTLLDHGATMDSGILNACMANGRKQASEFLAARGAHLDDATAAGLGHLAGDASNHQGFLYACQYGRFETVEFLLAKGVPITVCDRQAQSGLHWAVIGGHPEIVKLLLRHHAPLETTNSYGGTVYGQAIYSGASPEILEILKAAGAKVIQ